MFEDRLDEARHLDHRLAVLVVGLGVELRVPRDLAPRLRVIVHAPQVVAVRHRRERAVERQDLEAVPRQVELADDLRPQQRHDVRADGELEAGEDLFGDRGAADHVPALEHEHLASRAREIRGSGEAVVPAADDDHVGTSSHGTWHCRIAGIQDCRIAGGRGLQAAAARRVPENPGVVKQANRLGGPHGAHLTTSRGAGRGRGRHRQTPIRFAVGHHRLRVVFCRSSR